MKVLPSDPWPATDLERVPLCPVCTNERRTLLYGGLADVTFFTAPGRWQLWRCDACASGWLDPRPTAQSIHRAYGHYYTHDEADAPASQGGMRTKLGNGYRNWRFGAALEPSLWVGRYVMPVFPAIRRLNEQMYRYLPRKPIGARRTVLDIGCGNGEFLSNAAQIGWTGYGVEPDPKSRELAEAAGFRVAPTFDSLDTPEDEFHAVTMSHVIEHVCEPADLLEQVASRLVPGGTLYIATPNLNSIGHQLYGQNWRGLEIPRHLVLFNRSSLNFLLGAKGFEAIRSHAIPDAIAFTEGQSRRIAAGSRPYDLDGDAIGPHVNPSQRRAATGNGEQAEFLVVTARRPRA